MILALYRHRPKKKKAQSENSVIHLSGIWACPLGTNHYRRGGGVGFWGIIWFSEGKEGDQSSPTEYKEGL